ncbi:Alpha/Beta hydrolase protein [Mycena latifolia]|nr:Alpha/Beta hydrolase protein [Mycena latifolia]
MSAPIHSWQTIPTAPDTALQVLTSMPAAGSANKNPTLLFVHFWGGSPRTFSALAARLALDFPLVLPALRGWGASTGPADPGAYGVSDNAADLVALVALLHADAASDFFKHGLIVVGHSMGAKIAQVLAARGALRGLLRGLILLGPAPLGRLELPPDVRAQQRAAYASRESAEQALRLVMLGSEVSADAVRALVDDVMAGSEHAKLAWPDYGVLEDYEDLAAAEDGVEGLKIPVVIVVGGVDKIETAERVDERVVQVLEKAGASVKMTVLDGVGHLIPVEAPTEVEDIIREFVQEM